MNKTKELRHSNRLWLFLVIGINLLATIGASALVGNATMMIGLTSLALGLCGALSVQLGVSSATHRALAAIFLQGQVAVFVAAFAGHHWQIDAHMHFFATMGLLILLVDYRAVLAGAATVAVHHLALNFTIPSLVYPDGTDFGRTIMHAVILIMSTLALSYVSRALAVMMNEAEVKDQDREAMINLLQTTIGKTVADGVSGDFSGRISAQFDDARLESVARGTNTLIEIVEQGVMETCRMMSKVAKGDLSSNMEGQFQGAFNRLQTDVNATVTELRGLFTRINALSAEVTRETLSIAKGSESLSQQANNQAAALEETSAAMQEMNRNVSLNVASANGLSTLAATSMQNGEKGRFIVDDASGAMTKMAKSAGRISEIVEMMDEISFQTNLLALNASVEAARAGEAGQGFAIVAQEVRSLAHRSSESSSAIRSLIQESAQDVSQGVKFVDQLGATLTGMIASAAEVATMAKEIAENSAGQSHSLSEISAAVVGIDQTTQRTAAAADAYLTKSQKLIENAEALESALRMFQLNAGRAGNAQPRAA